MILGGRLVVEQKIIAGGADVPSRRTLIRNNCSFLRSSVRARKGHRFLGALTITVEHGIFHSLLVAIDKR